jgi:hypothetical protein
MTKGTTTHSPLGTHHGGLAGIAATDHHAAALLESLLTTEGDIVRRGASAAERLAKGTEGYHLEIVSGVPAWAIAGQNISARAYHNAHQSIPNNTTTVLAFNSERFDSDTIHDLVTNNSRLTCKTAGIYAVFLHVTFASHAVGRRNVSINRDTGYSQALSEWDTNANSSTHVSLACICSLAVDDYLTAGVYQTSGGALNVQVQDQFSPEFGMVKLLG